MGIDYSEAGAGNQDEESRRRADAKTGQGSRRSPKPDKACEFEENG
jgi:hypothetical protein